MQKIGKPRTTKGLAAFCGKIAVEKLATNVLILDLTAIDSAPTDYFVICTSNSEMQSKAITDEVNQKCRDMGIDKPRAEGLTTSYWVLLDFFDVVMHIMLPEARNFYQLEKLWGDAKFYTVTGEGKLKTYKRK
ncbi:MAG: ribosome silencing factor [bacterium]